MVWFFLPVMSTLGGDAEEFFELNLTSDWVKPVAMGRAPNNNLFILLVCFCCCWCFYLYLYLKKLLLKLIYEQNELEKKRKDKQEWIKEMETFSFQKKLRWQFAYLKIANY